MKLSQLEVGQSVENDEYEVVTQRQISDFAHATGDLQWIHIDAEKCQAHSPYKTTIAHGFLTVSLMPKMFAKAITINPQETTMINYGMDGLRFIEAVRVNDALKYQFCLTAIEQKSAGALYIFDTKALIKGRDKPALVGKFMMLVLS